MASTVCPLTRVTGPSVTLSPAISQPIERTPQCDNQCCRVTQCDATWRDDHSISRVSLPSSAPLSTLASIDQQPTQTLSTQGSPAYTSLYPQLILELIVPVVTSVNISSHWVGMYACTSQCHPADLHHGDQVRYRQPVWFLNKRVNMFV